MAIDYQQILMEMNRPRRRTGSSARKCAAFLVFSLIFGGGAYAVWHFDLAGRVWGKAHALVTDFLRARDAGATSAPDTGTATLHVRDQAVSRAGSDPVQADTVPVAALVANPAGPAMAAVQAASPAAPSSPPVATPARTPEPQPSSVSATPAAARFASSDPGPALSEARLRMRAADQLFATNPAEALRLMEDLLKTNPQPDEAAEAAYRVGYAARMLRDDDKAQQVWRATAEKWPKTRGGRFSALALADAWYRLHAGTRPQISYWDDIQALYSQVLGQDDAPFLPEAVKAGVKENLARINDAVIFGSAPTTLARYHKVEQGELLSGIAGKYRVDYESIARVNGIDPNRIQVGMDLKLVIGEVSIVVRKHQNDLSRTPTVTWYLDNRWVREYPACVGDGNKTPAGTYSLISKERDPSWTNPANGQLLSNSHPENILGSRWMAMKGMNTQGLGIHGTTVTDSIPGYTSAGCVRLLNKDVEELFSYARIGAKVTVVD